MDVPPPREIRRRRKALGASQAEVGRRAGISQSMVARVEQGAVDPRVSSLVRIIEALRSLEKERGPATAGDVMEPPPPEVAPSDVLAVVSERLHRSGSRYVVVVEGTRRVGAVRRDTIAAAQGHAGSLPVAGDIMSPPLPEAGASAGMRQLQALMTTAPAILVVSAGRVVGLVERRALVHPSIVRRPSQPLEPAGRA